VCFSTLCDEVTESRDGCHDNEQQVVVDKSDVRDSELLSADDGADLTRCEDIVSCEDIDQTSEDIDERRHLVEELMRERDELSGEIELMKQSLKLAHSNNDKSVTHTYISTTSSNNNNNDNVYGAVIVAQSHCES